MGKKDTNAQAPEAPEETAEDAAIQQPEPTESTSPAAEEKPAKVAKAKQRDPLIKTVSEHAALSLTEQAAFREAGGTVCEDEAI